MLSERCECRYMKSRLSYFLKTIAIFTFLFLPPIAKSQVIVVRVDVPLHRSDTLFLAGSHNSWSPADPNSLFSKVDSLTYIFHHKSISFPIDCKVTRGSWSRVEVTNSGSDIENRTISGERDDTIYFKIGGWKDDFVKPVSVTTAQPGVTIWSEAFFMPQLGKARTIRIYLPPNYETSGIRYPVIYMHDGQNLFDALTSFSGEWGVDEAADSLSVNAGLSCIIVGVDNGGESRIAELTPWRNDAMEVGGQGAQYAEFIVKTLKPTIDSVFRTLSGQRTTFVGGSSLGGLMSLYMAMKYPSIFGGAIVFSPSLWFTNDIFYLLKKSNIGGNQCLYIYGGEAESAGMVPDILKAKKILNSKYMKVSISKDGKHNEYYWRKEFPVALEWILK